MQRQVAKVRLYPTLEQQIALAKAFGCARWWWNYALNESIRVYKETGKGLSQSALNSYLPKLKEQYVWLSECYSQVLQAVSLNLSRAYINFFEKRAAFPKFKSKKARQFIQYPQNIIKIEENYLKVPKIGLVKARFHRLFNGEIKIVTISKTPSGKYYASILYEVDLPEATTSTKWGGIKNWQTLAQRFKALRPHIERLSVPRIIHEGLPIFFSQVLTGKVAGVDLGVKDFAIVYDGCQVSKFSKPKHFAKYEKNLARKQAKLARKQQRSNSRHRYGKVVARIYERVSNARQDFLHKLSRKLVDDNQVIVVENLNVKGMLRNRNLTKAISDNSWGLFVNFIAYKLERKGEKLLEIDRFFPSSKLCSNCFYQTRELPLEVRSWTCPSCCTHHDTEANAAANIRAEGIRMLSADGTAVAAEGGGVRPKLGRKSKVGHLPLSSETHATASAWR